MTRAFKYILPFTLYGLAVLAFTKSGVFTWLPLLYTFIGIPVLEIMIKPASNNLSAIEEDIQKVNPVYDYILYAVVVFQFVALWLFFNSMLQVESSLSDTIGRVISMGLLCGIFGINVAHELGHRVNFIEQLFAKSLLLTSLYMHFFIEHNKGHHKHVATPHDPSTAKLNQSLYRFWLQTLPGTYLNAWHIAIADASKKNKVFPKLNNEMFLFQVIQLVFVIGVFYFFGVKAMTGFLMAALIGGLLLEAVNYIEHYGLLRKTIDEGRYERVLPQHSWNSDHIFGRLLLFELSRHSDHHYLASRKYQILRSMDQAPQMPTVYPGMILLALVPFCWFGVMDKQLKKYAPAQGV
jgi:alkane 1-monooxygenase